MSIAPSPSLERDLPPCPLPVPNHQQLDDYYYECESMHGLEKTKVVAQSLRGAVDWIENVCKEVRRGSQAAHACVLLYGHAS